MNERDYQKLLNENPEIQGRDQNNDPTEAQKLLRSEARKAAREALSIPFEQIWESLDGPPLRTEFMFYKEKGRRWKTDYTNIEAMVMIELEGAIFSDKSGHKGAGQIEDMKKYNAARIEGYQVFTLGTGMIDIENIKPIVDHIKQRLEFLSIKLIASGVRSGKSHNRIMRDTGIDI